jgi:hypothetical protein
VCEQFFSRKSRELRRQTRRAESHRAARNRRALTPQRESDARSTRSFAQQRDDLYIATQRHG